MITAKAKAWAFLRCAVFALEFAAAHIDEQEMKVAIHRAREVVEEVMERINTELQLYVLDKVVEGSPTLLSASDRESDQRVREVILSAILGG